MNADVDAIIELIKKPGKSLLTTHLNPDMDSVASNLALADVLREYGHEVDLISQDELPQMGFLKGFFDIQQRRVDDLDLAFYDYYWCLDMAEELRSGRTREMPESVTVIDIDHHHGNGLWGKYNYVDEKAASASSLLLRLFQWGGIQIDKDRAQMLLTGIAGDTGFFTYPTIESFEEAGALMRAGADCIEIRYQVLQQIPAEDVLFLAKALETLKVYPDQRVAVITVSERVWNTFGVQRVKINLVMDYLPSIKGTDFGAVIIEDRPGMLRVRLRTRTPGYDVRRIAQSLGGGGHIAVAGALMDRRPLGEVVQQILDLV